MSYPGSTHDLFDIYTSIRPAVARQLTLFKNRRRSATDRDLFIQLVFCLLTPQSKARQCWRAVERLLETDLLFSGSDRDIAMEIPIVRFRNKKALFIVEARRRFYSVACVSLRTSLERYRNNHDKRSWLIATVKGYGTKEASHFLRNIGFGSDLAILDRHILKNLVAHGVIDGVPSNMSPARYRAIESSMVNFSRSINIPLDYLDFVLWYKETGDIFQ